MVDADAQYARTLNILHSLTSQIKTCLSHGNGKELPPIWDADQCVSPNVKFNSNIVCNFY